MLTSSSGLPLPRPRGPLSRSIADVLLGRHSDWLELVMLAEAIAPPGTPGGLLLDDDAQLSMLMLYELHYRGIIGVDEAFEWNPNILAVRAVLERRFEGEIRARAAIPDSGGADVADVLFRMTAPEPGNGAGLAAFLARYGTVDNYREFLISRSVYHLKEADPHTWAIPRLAGSAKAALVEVQADEYGGGRAERMHAALFARSMRALGLNEAYGVYVDLVPGVVLAGVNAMSMFGLHRRLLGAIVGHLAAFEMTSSLPNRLYGNGLRRLEYGEDATAFFDEHVVADAVHEQIAGRDLAGGLAAAEPARGPDILFGAAACLVLDDLAARHLQSSFAAGVSALLPAAVSGSSPLESLPA